MKDYSLYYYIPWPDSQKWLDRENAIEQGYIILADTDELSCFVDEFLFKQENGLD